MSVEIYMGLGSRIEYPPSDVRFISFDGLTMTVALNGNSTPVTYKFSSPEEMDAALRDWMLRGTAAAHSH